MDSYEATRVVFSRIQALDPENASKITGYVLIQEHGEQEMIRLAFGPESLLRNLIFKAKTHLGISSSNPCTPSSPSPLSPFSTRPINPLSRHHSFNIPSPLPINSNPNPSYRVSPAPSPSYAAVLNGSSNVCFNNSNNVSENNNTNTSCTSIPSASTALEPFNEYNLQNRLSFLNEKVDLLGSNNTSVHRRSLSLSDASFGGFEDCGSGFGWKPCLYFSRGFCKNGSGCKFVHGGGDGGFADSMESSFVGSPPNKFPGMFNQSQEDMLRSKTIQQHQQRLSAMVTSSFPHNQCMSFPFSDTHRSAAATLMMGDESLRLGRCRPERSDFPVMGMGGNSNPVSRQIYLTFPADSTFREEDVSNYFSIYGPVHDVRIPYQQKRMFGFVTFVYPETVNLILSKGNPHFVCDSRVLVKPYKEKGKVPDKKHLHLERGEYSPCSTPPPRLESRDPYDLHFGSRMFYNTQDMLLRRKLEQGDLQQAIELHGRRLMNLQLLGLKNHHHPHHLNMPFGTTSNPNQSLMFPIDGLDQELVSEDGNNDTPATSASPTFEEANAACSNDGNANGSSEEESSKVEDYDFHESGSFEHILPESLLASPQKAAPPDEACNENNADSQRTGALKTAATNLCSLHIPRISSGNGVIEM